MVPCPCRCSNIGSARAWSLAHGVNLSAFMSCRIGSLIWGSRALVLCLMKTLETLLPDRRPCRIKPCGEAFRIVLTTAFRLLLYSCDGVPFFGGFVCLYQPSRAGPYTAFINIGPHIHAIYFFDGRGVHGRRRSLLPTRGCVTLWHQKAVARPRCLGFICRRPRCNLGAADGHAARPLSRVPDAVCQSLICRFFGFVPTNFNVGWRWSRWAGSAGVASSVLLRFGARRCGGGFAGRVHSVYLYITAR